MGARRREGCRVESYCAIDTRLQSELPGGIRDIAKRCAGPYQHQSDLRIGFLPAHWASLLVFAINCKSSAPVAGPTLSVEMNPASLREEPYRPSQAEMEKLSEWPNSLHCASGGITPYDLS